MTKEEMARVSLKEKLRITVDSLVPPFILIFACMGPSYWGLPRPPRLPPSARWEQSFSVPITET